MSEDAAAAAEPGLDEEAIRSGDEAGEADRASDHRGSKRFGAPVGPAELVDPILGLDAEAFGDAVDVVEVGADLGGVVDGPVVPPGVAKTADSRLALARRVTGERLGILQQGDRRRVETGGSPVAGDAVDELGIGDLRPEVVEMRADSVVTVVRL